MLKQNPATTSLGKMHLQINPAKSDGGCEQKQ